MLDWCLVELLLGYIENRVSSSSYPGNGGETTSLHLSMDSDLKSHVSCPGAVAAGFSLFCGTQMQRAQERLEEMDDQSWQSKDVQCLQRVKERVENATICHWLRVLTGGLYSPNFPRKLTRNIIRVFLTPSTLTPKYSDQPFNRPDDTLHPQHLSPGQHDRPVIEFTLPWSTHTSHSCYAVMLSSLISPTTIDDHVVALMSAFHQAWLETP